MALANPQFFQNAGILIDYLWERIYHSSVFQELLQYIPALTAFLVGISDFNQMMSVLGDQRGYLYMSSSGAMLGMFLAGGLVTKMPSVFLERGLGVAPMMLYGALGGFLIFYILSKFKPSRIIKALQYIPVL